MEALYNSLNSIKVLRCTVGQVFSCLANGLGAEQTINTNVDIKGDGRFLQELDKLITTVGQQLREVEQNINNLTQPGGAFSLGTASYLNHECSQDRQALYGHLVLSYKWTDKIHEYSNLCTGILGLNSLKRSYVNSSSRKRRAPASTHSANPQTMDNAITQIDRMYNDMNVTISRPFTTNAVVQVSLGRVLQALIAFKGIMIEWVVVKGYGEQLDLWTQSRYKVFQKVTENAQAAMLHFSSPTLPELAVKSYMTWFHSYINLFSEPCKRCSCHLLNAMPPIWRDYRTLEPYHQDCRSYSFHPK